MKLTTMEQDLLPIEELMDVGRKSIMGREECLLKLIFRHCCCVAEDNIAAAGKGRLLLILAGTMKTPLLPLHGISSVGFITLVSCFVFPGSWPSISPGFFLSISMCMKELDMLVSRLVQKTIQITSFEIKLLELERGGQGWCCRGLRLKLERKGKATKGLLWLFFVIGEEEEERS
ncbi:hypothetical protein POTOM_025748 [Populus tomentosa]|uniref:Uncharacterized protein n=1 Tax=Populus tomentosa TaxID=118781 RepID=A0A8X7ZJ78_POPTO|nr:hypothetical protein POTOM_025748 [Populus tomentosa]